MEARTKNNFDIDSYKYWSTQIEQANISREGFVNRGYKIEEIYRAENDELEYTSSNYNILYANTETILPVVYSDRPTPDVRARDASKISYRKSAKILEEGISFYLNNEFNDIARIAVTDFLLSGVGLLRPKYVATTEKIEDVVESLDDDIEALDKVVYEEIEFEYVAWNNFIFPDNCSSWQDLPWIAFRAYVTYDEAAEMFGEDKASQLNYNTSEQSKDKGYSADANQGSKDKKACVYEIWDKFYREQLFFSETKEMALLEINDDPLGLKGFFPVPKPMLSITTGKSLIPVPFFKQYEDQARELNEVCARIASLTENMKRRGFYDASMDELGNINNLDDNEFAPVKNWNELLGKGGINGVMQFEDITSYANTLALLTQRKQELINDIYQIIGISDIRRAATDARETLGAQKLKSRYGTVRISTYQRKVQEFFRDLMAITGEIIATQFEPSTLAVITNHPINNVTKINEQGEEEVVEVGVNDLITELRDREPSNVIVDIQTDSTALEDTEEDKQDLLSMTQALSQVVQIAPAMASIIGKDATAGILLGYVEKYKLGRGIQQEVTDHIEALKKQPPEQQPPSDAQIRANVEMQKAQMNTQLELQKAQIDAVSEEKDRQLKVLELQLKAKDIGVSHKIEYEKLDIEAINTAIKAAGLKAEQANPNDNAIVGS